MSSHSNEGNRAASARYNTHYNNQTYEAVASLMMQDLNAARESEAVVEAMALVTNVAHHMCGHTEYQKTLVLLTHYCAQHSSDPAIEAVAKHLQQFELPGQTTSADFERTAKALRCLHMLSPTLKESVSFANAVHGWRGRMTYYLLAAASLLIEASVQLLLDGDLSYISDKLKQALHQIGYAYQEGNDNSKSIPYLFWSLNPPTDKQ